MNHVCAVVLLFLAGCKAEEPACDPSLDSDQDGIYDCTELDLGLDMMSADSDLDGVSDPDELDCKSNPVDPNEVCYDCGWIRNDPGNLTSDGADFGDTIDNIKLHDQCGEKVEMWDFYGEYHILYLTAAW